MRRRDIDYMVGLLLADLTLVLIALYLASLARLTLSYGARLTESWVKLPVPVYIMAAVVWLALSAALAIYTPSPPCNRLEEIKAVMKAVLFSNMTFAGLLYMSYRSVPRLLFLYSAILQLILLIGVRLVLSTLERLHYNSQNGARVLIIGAGQVGQNLATRIRSRRRDLILVGYLDDDSTKQGQVLEGVPVLGGTQQVPDLVSQECIDEVIFALPLRAHESLESLVMALQAMPVRVRVVLDFFNLAFFRATIEDLDGILLVGLRDPAIRDTDRLIKRLFDLVLASLSLLVTAPIMLVVAVAIRLDSPGPVLFRQQRVGENGKPFTIYKFRSMTADTESRQREMLVALGPNQLLHKHAHDPRITRIGRFLRHTSLDELPQLVNVLKGEMSLVGPRPELPWLVDRYEAWQRKRFAVSPGITGWWQINGRSDRPMHLHVDDDLYYIQHYSPWLDLRILVRTIGVVLKGRGAF